MKNIVRAAVFFAALLLAGAMERASAQHVFVYTEANLGYPVPEPVASLTPVLGFRDVDSLLARLFDLATTHQHMTMQTTGTSIHGESIYSFRLSAVEEADSEGLPKAGAAIQGMLHAREWAAAEATMEVLEWLAEEQESDPLAAFLLDRMEILFHPIANPDGLRRTQDYWSSVVKAGTSSPPGTRPSASGDRDGRNRRKNMRNVETELSDFSDYLFGVDLNRNYPHGFGGGSGSSTAITYRGASAGSEPETLASFAAESLIDTSRLRYFVDMHSFIPNFFVSRYSDAGLNAAVTECYEIMRDAIAATSGLNFPARNVDVDGVGGGDTPVGAADEYFANKYRVMSYTAEMRPPQVSFWNGFVLPNDEVEAMREEMRWAISGGLYYAAGPAALLEVLAIPMEDGSYGPEPVVHQVRAADGSATRSLVHDIGGKLTPGEEYYLVLRFDRPMRRMDDVLPAFFPGRSGSMEPQLDYEGAATFTFHGWSFDLPGGAPISRYPGDTAMWRMALSEDHPAGEFVLSVDAVDMAGIPIDGDPLTVADWSGESGWVQYERTSDVLTILEVDGDEAGVEGWLLH